MKLHLYRMRWVDSDTGTWVSRFTFSPSRTLARLEFASQHWASFSKAAISGTIKLWCVPASREAEILSKFKLSRSDLLGQHRRA
jgi:hypothetical protein